MPRALAILAGLAGLSLTGGCADLMQQSTISQIAPEWFAAKAVEVKGEGYPELADVPQPTPFSGSLDEWRDEADELKSSADEIEEARMEAPRFPTPDEIRAKAAQWRALAEASPVQPPPPAEKKSPG